MEIPDISIPKIDVQKINVPVHNPYQVLNVPLPSLKLPGCVRYHRDASPKNTALYDDDLKGTTISCPYGISVNKKKPNMNNKNLSYLNKKKKSFL